MTDSTAQPPTPPNSQAADSASAAAPTKPLSIADEADEGLKPVVIKLRMPVRLDSGELIEEIRGEGIIVGADIDAVEKLSNHQQLLRVAHKRFNISSAVTSRMYAGDYNAMIEAVVVHLKPLGK